MDTVYRRRSYNKEAFLRSKKEAEKKSFGKKTALQCTICIGILTATVGMDIANVPIVDNVKWAINYNEDFKKLFLKSSEFLKESFSFLDEFLLFEEKNAENANVQETIPASTPETETTPVTTPAPTPVPTPAPLASTNVGSQSEASAPVFLTLSNEKFAIPLKGRVTSPFGPRKDPITGKDSFHHGVDIAGKVGDGVYSSKSGRVIAADFHETLGNYVKIDHGGGYVTLYGHLSKQLVKEKDNVKRGAKIGLVGTSGYSTGPHLHFEIRENGVSVDPKKYVKF